MVRCLGEGVREEGLRFRGVPTSTRTAELAREVGITVISLDEARWLDVTIDGADEFDGNFNLIKGGGGALLQEKIVATASDQMIVIADAAKGVGQLGAFPLPVEVIPFGWQTTKGLIEETCNAFGGCLLIDCHSMPSSQPGRRDLPDFVLGDRFGSSCTGQLTSLVERTLRKAGYSVVRNAPYAGGFTTRKYGRPKQHVHALQIEINRRLYLDEARVTKIDAMSELSHQLDGLMGNIAELSERLRP